MIQIKIILATLTFLFLFGCTPTLKVLEGATHACGNVHLEGFATDSQGDVVVVKAPDTWTPEQVLQFCETP